MAYACTELPWSMIMKFIFFLNAKNVATWGLGINCIIKHLCIVAWCEFIPRRGCYRQSNTERRVFDRAENYTSFNIKACSFNSALITIGNSSGINHSVTFVQAIQAFHIFRIAFIINILDAQSNTPIKTVIRISTYIEIVIWNPSTMRTVEIV